MTARGLTEAECDARSDRAKRLGLRPGPRWGVGGWTAEEHALLGTMRDEEVAARTGRTVSAATSRRHVHAIPPFPYRPVRKGRG